MQATSKELYEKVHDRTGEDLALIKSVGDSVFKRASSLLKRPDHLIIKLKGIGTWYMRKKKLNDYIERFGPYYTQENPERETPERLQQYMNERAQYETLIERQKEYKVFLEKKATIREIRHKTQPIQKPEGTC